MSDYVPPISKEDLAREYYDNHRSLEDIGAEYWVGEATVSRWMRYYGLETRKFRPVLEIPVDRLKELIEKGYSVTVIARRFGVSTTKIYKVMRENNLGRYK